MPYSEKDNITQTKLALLSQRAREDPKLKFTSLAHLLNAGFLKECYYRLGRDRASGMDGVSWKEYGQRLDENLSDLVQRMKAKRYKPLPCRRVYIPKDKHSRRPLGLPSLEDKIVQKGIATLLEAIYEPDFLDGSYGFRPGRGCHQALAVVHETISRRPVHYVIEADIKGFFDNVSHEWMMRFLEVRIKDPSLLLLIRRFLKAGYMEDEQLVQPERGTPQGGNLSPMLANIFLHYVLDVWFEKAVKPRIPGVCEMVRYADDFVCMVENEQDAQAIERVMHKRFAKFGLPLHPDKTGVIHMNRSGSDGGRRDGHGRRTFDFLGFTHYWGKSRRGRPLLGRKTQGKRLRRALQQLNAWLKSVRNTDRPSVWWPTLQAKLRGHYQYYGVSGNSRSISRFGYLATRLVFKWLNRRSQKASFTWSRFLVYLTYYRLPRPCIMYRLYSSSKSV